MRRHSRVRRRIVHRDVETACGCRRELPQLLDALRGVQLERREVGIEDAQLAAQHDSSRSAARWKSASVSNCRYSV
jgi:hypothetical protein